MKKIVIILGFASLLIFVLVRMTRDNILTESAPRVEPKVGVTELIRTKPSRPSSTPLDTQTEEYKIVTEETVAIEALVENRLSKQDIKGAVDLILSHGDSLLSEGLNLSYEEGVKMTPEEQEENKRKGQQTITDYTKFLKSMAYRAPELLNDLKFSKSLYDFAMLEKPRDKTLISDLLKSMQEKHSKTVGNEIYCRIAEQKDFEVSQVDTDWENILLKCSDNSSQDMLLCMYVIGIHESYGAEETERITSKFKKVLPNFECL